MALGTTQGLVNHDPGVLQAAALALGAGTEQESSHACGEADTHRVHIRFDVLHRVEDAEAVVNRPAGRVDVEVDIFLGILSFEEQHLGHDPVGGVTGDSLTKEDDSLAQKPGINVKGPFSPAGLLNHNGDHLSISRVAQS